jgi:tetratricopeptide (TPR) repeat protein
MKFGLALLLAFAIVPPAAAQVGAHEASQVETRSAKVAEAIAAIKRKDSPAAIAILDPLLAQYEAEHPAGKEVIFCTTGTTDVLAKLAGAAAGKTDAVALDTTWCYALWAKGFALADLGRFAEALPPLERATAMMPGNAHFLSELGYVHQARKDWEKALTAYTAAARIGEALTDPADRKRELRRAWFGMAYSLIELNRLDAAEDILVRCLEMVPDDAKIRNELNFVREKLGKPPLGG